MAAWTERGAIAFAVGAVFITHGDDRLGSARAREVFQFANSTLGLTDDGELVFGLPVGALGAKPLFRYPSLNGLGAGGPFFHNPLG